MNTFLLIKEHEPKLVGKDTWLNPTLKPAISNSEEEFESLLKTSNSIQEVAHALEIPTGQLIRILKNKANYYNEFKIPKKSGGFRSISSPQKGLDIIQRKIKPFIEKHYKPKSSAYGFIKGSNKGIKENAKNHKNCRIVINLDLKNFFDSVNFGRVRGIFKSKPFGLSDSTATILANICTYKGCLPQGACTSPVLSNLSATQLDRTMKRISRSYRLTYSRYADDLSFSTNKIPSKLIKTEEDEDIFGHENNTYEITDYFESLIRDCGFEVNHKKFRVQKTTSRQEVTGLTVNRKVNVSKKFLRETRSIINSWKKDLVQAENYYIEKYNLNKNKKSDGNYLKNVVFGRLSFIRHIKGPDDSTYLNLCKKVALLEKNLPKFLETDKEKCEMYDIFICHAKEDKADIAFPMNDALKEKGLKTFIDNERIEWGDSLIDKINSAIAQSKLVVAILSKESIGKNWPIKELNVVLNREINTGEKRLLILMKDSDEDEITKKLPLITDKLYKLYKNNATELADEIYDILT